MKILLAHGVLGFGNIIPGNLQRVNYFNGVKEHLEQRPHTEVFEPSVDFKGSIETRGEQLANAIRHVGAPVHVIAHSMGGLDARWAIANRPAETKDVLSLVTVGTPHHGSEVADAIAQHRPSILTLPAFVIALLEALGPALADLTTARGRAFDDATPDRPGLTYREIAGDARHAAGREALLFQAAALIGHITGQPNDGVVTVASATRGERPLFAVWPFDHAGEIGWTPDVLLRPRRHLPLYDAIVNELGQHHGGR